MQWLAIALGGALGAMARYAVTIQCASWMSSAVVMNARFPLGTLIVNVLGSALIGVCYVLIIEKGALSAEWRHILMVGFLGAFTTFSTFSLDALNMWQNGHQFLALSYVSITFVASLVAVATAATLTLRFF